MVTVTKFISTKTKSLIQYTGIIVTCLLIVKSQNHNPQNMNIARFGRCFLKLLQVITFDSTSFALKHYSANTPSTTTATPRAMERPLEELLVLGFPVLARTTPPYRGGGGGGGGGLILSGGKITTRYQRIAPKVNLCPPLCPLSAHLILAPPCFKRPWSFSYLSGQGRSCYKISR